MDNFIPKATIIKSVNNKVCEVQDIEILLQENFVQAFYVKPANPSGRLVLFTHWLASKPDANRTQFLNDAKELAKYGFTSLLVDTFFANWPKAKKKWTRTDASFDKALVLEQVEQLHSCLKWLRNDMNNPKHEIILVGHDFGAMFNCLLLNKEIDILAFVFMAGIGDFSDWFTMRKKMTEPEKIAYLNEMKDVAPINHFGLGSNIRYLFQFGKKDKSFVPYEKTIELIEKVKDKMIEVKYYNEGHAIHLNSEATCDRIHWINAIA